MHINFGGNMKKNLVVYESAEIEIISFDVKDVISTSGQDDDDDNGWTRPDTHSW